ncbi:signal recognition particle 9 kDa protein-like [Watersipora subatra]|uniref:signal recognition particle 9 kDa protein-like n=1 Tax=Watersipora subatra TaxID=2589382 RepID=UPI00355BEFEA
MTYTKSWEEFEKTADMLYKSDPIKCRYVMKYVHSEGKFVVKLTNDVVCIQYRSDLASDLKKMEKFSGHLMRLMAAK